MITGELKKSASENDEDDGKLSSLPLESDHISCTVEMADLKRQCKFFLIFRIYSFIEFYNTNKKESIQSDLTQRSRK